MLSIFIKELSHILQQHRLLLLLLQLHLQLPLPPLLLLLLLHQRRLRLLRLHRRPLLPPPLSRYLLLHLPQLTQQPHSARCPPRLLLPPPLCPPPATVGRAAAALAASSPARITPASSVKLEPYPPFAKTTHSARSVPLAATALTRTCHLRCRALLVPSRIQAL
jgi:hypothetical protein